MRRALLLALVACAAAAAGLALGATGAPGPPAPHEAHAAAPTVASLKATIRRLLPATRCDAGDVKRARALKLRTAALKRIATQPPRELRKRKAALRRAVALLRQAKRACAAAPTPPAPPAPGPAPPAPPVPPGPPAPTPFVITLHVAAGPTTAYTEPSAMAPGGAIHIDLVNASSLRHFVIVRTAAGQQMLGRSALSPVGGSTSLDITLAAGAYQIFCDNNDHHLLGMIIPFTVT